MIMKLIVSGKFDYIDAVSQQDEDYVRLVNDTPPEVEDAIVNNAISTYNALADDENYKQKFCKRCPHCNRVVQKVILRNALFASTANIRYKSILIMIHSFFKNKID